MKANRNAVPLYRSVTKCGHIFKFRFVGLLVSRTQRLLLEEKLSPEATDEVENYASDNQSNSSFALCLHDVLLMQPAPAQIIQRLLWIVAGKQLHAVGDCAVVIFFFIAGEIAPRFHISCGHKVKVGHTGTLDPFATGLLILLSGKMTKKSNEFLKLDKVYEATLKLGYTSTTGDPEGEITEYDSTWAGDGAGGSPAARRREPSTVGEAATAGPAERTITSRSSPSLSPFTT